MMFYTRPRLLAISIAATWFIMLSMMVIPGHAATARLRWIAPTTNANGSPLNDLSGYKVYYRPVTGTYGTPRTIIGNTTDYMLTDLADGVQYVIAVKAYDTSNNESAFSNEVRFPDSVLAASFTATPPSGPAPLTVIFTSTSTGNPTAWAWNFDDGSSTGNQPTITHTFTTPDTYNVRLTVTAGGLSNTVTQPITVTASPQPPPSGLVAAYSFNEGSGTRANDSSGNGNHGTISGATWTTTTQGKFGRALAFDGVNDLVTIADSPTLDLSAGMTLEAWVNPTALRGGSANGWRTVILKQRPGNLAYALYANTNTNRPSGEVFLGSTIGNIETRGTAELSLNRWSHLAVAYNGGSIRLYVNGGLASSYARTGRITASGDPLRIGGNGVWGEYFQGRIDEVRIYNRALTSTEIQADMNRAVGSTASTALTVQNQGIQLNASNILSTLGQSTPPLSNSKQQTANGSSASNTSTTNTSTTNTSTMNTSTMNTTTLDLLTSDHLEVGEVTVDHQWKRVDLSKSFTDPVVVAKAMSARDAAPAVVGIRQVDATGFELRLWPWADSSQSRAPETVGYLVIERGRFRLADGTSVESGTIDTNTAHPVSSLAFAQPFQRAPVVLTALMNIPDQTAVTGRPTRISEQGFQLQLQPQGASPNLDAVQSVGYVAWERSTGTLGGLTFEVDRHEGVTPGQFSPLTFKEVFAGPPVFLADVQSGPGGNPINVRWEHKDLGGVDVTIDDESDLAGDGANPEGRQDVGYILIQ